MLKPLLCYVRTIAVLSLVGTIAVCSEAEPTADDSCLAPVAFHVQKVNLVVGDTTSIVGRLHSCAAGAYNPAFSWRLDGPELLVLAPRNDTTVHLTAVAIGTTWITAIGSLRDQPPQPLETIQIVVR